MGVGEKLLTHLNSALKVLLGLDIFPRVPKKKLNFVDQCYHYTGYEYCGPVNLVETATSPSSSAMVLERFTTSSRKSPTQCARETGVSSTSERRILKAVKWKVYIPRLLHAINDDDPDRRMQFCEWFQQTVNEDEEFVTKIV